MLIIKYGKKILGMIWNLIACGYFLFHSEFQWIGISHLIASFFFFRLWLIFERENFITSEKTTLELYDFFLRYKLTLSLSVVYIFTFPLAVGILVTLGFQQKDFGLIIFALSALALLGIPLPKTKKQHD